MNNKELKNKHINDTENHAGYICKLQKDFLQQINRIDLELIYIIKLDNTKDTLNANNKKRNNLSFIKNEKLEKNGCLSKKASMKNHGFSTLITKDIKRPYYQF